MGGTLDGDGLHWLERFLSLYQSFGTEFPREKIREAFDEADRISASDAAIASSNLNEMVELHVRWQLAHLGLTNPALERHLVDGFITPMRKAAADNARLLADLAANGFELGVVSNGCGNVEKLCADLGYMPFFSLVVDSRRVGLYKPDPAIFRYAAEKVGGDPASILMVGDSFERDVLPAKKAGLKTAWLEGPTSRVCPDLTLVDLHLRKLADLPAALAASSPAFA